MADQSKGQGKPKEPTGSGPARERVTGIPVRPQNFGDAERDRASNEHSTGGRERLTGSVSAPRPTGNQVPRERVTQPPPRATGNQAPRERVTGTGAAPRPSGPGAPAGRVTGSVPIPPGATTQSGLSTSGARELTAHQKQALSSAFSDAARMKRLDAVLGKTAETGQSMYDDQEDEPTAMGVQFDGKTAPTVLTGRDVWKAVQAPVQSREGRRSSSVYQNVINQFAVATNPRYAPDAPDKPRGHIFIWDLSRAMNCEVPHFVGARELSLGQTVDWLRHEGPMRGWSRGGNAEAVEAARHGYLTIALPREVKLKHLAVVLPVDPDPDGKPRLASASRKIGTNLSLHEAIGVYAAEYFFHA